MPAGVYNKLFHDYNLAQLKPIQTTLKAYISTGMIVILSCVPYHPAHNKALQVISFNVTAIKGSVLHIHTDTLALQLVLVGDKLYRKISNSAKFVSSQTDRSDVFTINKKTQGNKADQQITM